MSLDVIERFFVCDLEKCLGACCIEGDAGAPVSEEECRKLKEILPVIWDDLLPEAKSVIERQGVAYVDEEGDLCTAAQESAKQALKLIPDSHGDPPITRRYTHLLSWVFAKRAIRVNGSRTVFRPLEIS